MFSPTPDLNELRAAIDHAPRLVEQFLQLYGVHRNTLERLMRQGTSGSTDRLLVTTAEAVVHDFFRDHLNYFHDLEVAAQALRATAASEPDDIYATLKARLLNTHGIRIKRRTIEEMTQALRVYDKENRIIYLSEALDYSNVVFQLDSFCNVECLLLTQSGSRETKIAAMHSHRPPEETSLH